ncbi:hypothetical protein B0H10DRAFT_2222582 [Mycena sp. CBHHK59/15]|nr:hypothetical protein B0H10DRAFT_2222582 [Mycena sp. CBHHK59/15]
MATRALCPSPSWRPAHSRVKIIHRGGVIFSMRAPRAPQSIVELSGSVFDHKPSAAFADNNVPTNFLRYPFSTPIQTSNPSIAILSPSLRLSSTGHGHALLFPFPASAPVYIFPSPKA